MNRDLQQMIETKLELETNLSRLKYDIQAYLIEHKLFEFFSVNWQALRQESSRSKRV